jgi:hypothetical protein
LESQRIGAVGIYGHSYLISSDPAPWAIDSFNVTIDPTSIQSSATTPADPFLSLNLSAANCLHEFMFSVTPSTDCMGWEYNTSFNSQAPWKKNFEGSCVRRRLWFRTIIAGSNLNRCRQELQEWVKVSSLNGQQYIRVGNLLQRNSTVDKWRKGVVRLNDSSLTVSGPEMFFSDFELPLSSLDIVITDPSQDTPGVFCFGLRFRSKSGKNLGMKVMLGASTELEREQWVCTIAQQIAKANPCFWRLSFGPPVSEAIVMQGDLQKQGHFMPNWKTRRFELRIDGTLSYFDERNLKGRIKLREGTVVTHGGEHGPNTIVIQKPDGYRLTLFSPDKDLCDRWVNKMTQVIEVNAVHYAGPRPISLFVRSPPHPGEVNDILLLLTTYNCLFLT